MSQPQPQPPSVAPPSVPVHPIVPSDLKLRSRAERKSTIDANQAKAAVEAKSKSDAADRSLVQEFERWCNSSDCEKLLSFTGHFFSKSTRDKVGSMLEALGYEIEKCGRIVTDDSAPNSLTVKMPDA